jgi:DNA-binding beta-propeller fold protein YncE
VVTPIVLLTSSLAQAALPIPPLPPYEPVNMSYVPGVSGLVTYNNSNGVAIVNPQTHTISPILLNEYDYTIDPVTEAPVGGPLGSEGGGRFDVAMTSTGRQALITNFGDSKVFFINFATGLPVVSGMAQLDMFAEDIAVHPNDQWALVTDGGFTPGIALLNISTRAWVPAGTDPVTLDPISYRMPEDEGDPLDPNDNSGRYANAVAIAPDGRTVVVADYFAGAIHVLEMDPATGSLAYRQTESLWKYGTDENALFPFQYRPVNIAISPDGRTVMAISPARSTLTNPDITPGAFYEGSNIAMFVIDQPGHVVRQPDVVLPWRIGGAQSAVFSPDGRKAYVEALYHDDEPPEPIDPDTYWIYQEIHELNITSPGHATLARSVRSPTDRGTSQLFGVDTIALDQTGNFLYVTNPTVSGGKPVIDVYNVQTFTHVKSIGTPQHYPDPMRNGGNPPLPPDENVSSDWIEYLIPTGIAFPQRAPEQIPTLSGWGMVMMMVMLSGVAAVSIGRRGSSGNRKAS